MATASAGLRTTSFAASAALLGLAAIAALTMSFGTITDIPLFEGPPTVTIETEPEPPPLEPATPQPPRAPTAHEEPIAFVPPTEVQSEQPAQPYVGFVPGPPEPVVITSPHWAREPRNLQRYYPRRAIQAGVEGDVVLDCRVSVAGMLTCTVVSETPANWGFAVAAQRIAGDYRMVPAQRDGVAVEGRYRMRVPFRLD